MNATQIHATFKSILNFLAQGKLRNAFEKTEILVSELQIGEFADRCAELQQNYRFLLRYYIDGINDPERKIVYNKLIARLFVLVSELREELLLRNSSNFEYTQKRYFPHRLRFSDYSSLFDALRYYHTQHNTLNESEYDETIELKRIRNNFELLLPDVFSILWLSTRFGNPEKQLFQLLLDEKYPGETEKLLAVSALTLNLWRMFDEAKLMLLLDCCQSVNQSVRQRALVGLCFVMARHNRFIPYFPVIRNRLVLLVDDSHISENLGNIIIQIISTVETEKISRKMREEILPEVMKISPLLKDKMDAENLLKSDEWEEGNPEWQELLESSGVGDKLKELSELQMEGADVYMGTFALLKNFSFFNEFSNWFLPFDAGFSYVKDLFVNDDLSLINAFLANNAMCNSDKYSFCLSVLQMPESQRNMLKSSFKMESEQLEEMARDEAMLTPDLAAKNISKQYVQDLFRFFKLHPQKSDFSDMFTSALFMHRSFLFDILSANTELKNTLAEYFFKKAYYEQALELFEELLLEGDQTASLYQKLGYSYQKLSRIDEALSAYLKADIIQPDDLWTIKKIALCYRLLGNMEKALESYQHADFILPDQQNIQLNIGQCLLELKRYKDALNLFYKLDALTENNYKVWRAISWCAFVAGDFNRASYYVSKLIEQDATKHDYLNAGHIAWAQRKMKDAAAYYVEALRMFDNNVEVFIDAIMHDKEFLKVNGISDDEIPLMFDELMYNAI